MSDLTDARDHARRMATAEHKPECQWTPPQHIWPKRPDPHCPGCVTDADRALWQQIANEITAHLARHSEDTLL